MRPANRLKLWLNAVGLSAFVAGVAVGLSVPAIYATIEPVTDDSPFLVLLREEYQLRPGQMEQIRRIWEQREAEIEIVNRMVYELDSVPVFLKNRVDEAKRRADDRIEVVLDSVQREKYRRSVDESDRPPDKSPESEK